MPASTSRRPRFRGNAGRHGGHVEQHRHRELRDHRRVRVAQGQPAGEADRLARRRVLHRHRGQPVSRRDESFSRASKLPTGSRAQGQEARHHGPGSGTQALVEYLFRQQGLDSTRDVELVERRRRSERGAANDEDRAHRRRFVRVADVDDRRANNVGKGFIDAGRATALDARASPRRHLVRSPTTSPSVRTPSSPTSTRSARRSVLAYTIRAKRPRCSSSTTVRSARRRSQRCSPRISCFRTSPTSPPTAARRRCSSIA